MALSFICIAQAICIVVYWIYFDSSDMEKWEKADWEFMKKTIMFTGFLDVAILVVVVILITYTFDDLNMRNMRYDMIRYTSAPYRRNFAGAQLMVALASLALGAGSILKHKLGKARNISVAIHTISLLAIPLVTLYIIVVGK